MQPLPTNYQGGRASEDLPYPHPPQKDLPISWNIAPSQDVLAIRFRQKTGQRSLDALRWGLVPYWAKDNKIAFKTINARVEIVEALKKRRCLIRPGGFYEWKKVLGGKILHAIGTRSRAIMLHLGG